MNRQVLIIDDESGIREVVREYGEAYGLTVDEAADGLDGLEKVQAKDYDCLILDIMMPNMDGYTTLKEIRQFSDVPVIMLSARNEEEDKLQGFDLGIDDYVAKPFSPKELMARLRVVMDRRRPLNSTIQLEGLVIDLDGHQMSVDGREIHLTNKEFDMLVYLINNRGVAISRDKLLENVWGDDSDSFDRTVDTHIKMLRKNLGPYGNRIVTVRGVGYRFE